MIGCRSIASVLRRGFGRCDLARPGLPLRRLLFMLFVIGLLGCLGRHDPDASTVRKYKYLSFAMELQAKLFRNLLRLVATDRATLRLPPRSSPPRDRSTRRRLRRSRNGP